MDKAEFDRVADEYEAMLARSIAASGESPEFFARYKIADVAETVKREGCKVDSLLDFGSGTGSSLPHLAELFPQAAVSCADVSKRCMDISRSRFPHIEADYREIEGMQLPFADASFDLVFSACVFHHIPSAQHRHWLGELHRVMRPQGRLFIFEHNPLNPLTVAAVRSCPFDDNAVLIGARAMAKRMELAGWRQTEIVYRIFFPHALAFARPMERWMRKLPLGAQYFISACHS